ncbi:MAG: VOC family protein [Bdellovibrionota bacterium]
MEIKFDHINLTVSNLEESIVWYKKIFGFTLVERGLKLDESRWAIVARNDFMVCMTEMSSRKLAVQWGEDADELANYHKVYHFGIRIFDEEKWMQKVNEFNLRLYYGGVVEYPHSKSWYIRDPSGHSIEVSYAGFSPLQFPPL